MTYQQGTRKGTVGSEISNVSAANNIVNPMVRLLFLAMTMKAWVNYSKKKMAQIKAANDNGIEYITSESEEADHLEEEDEDSEEYSDVSDSEEESESESEQEEKANFNDSIAEENEESDEDELPKGGNSPSYRKRTESLKKKTDRSNESEGSESDDVIGESSTNKPAPKRFSIWGITSALTGRKSIKADSTPQQGGAKGINPPPPLELSWKALQKKLTVATKTTGDKKSDGSPSRGLGWLSQKGESSQREQSSNRKLAGGEEEC